VVVLIAVFRVLTPTFLVVFITALLGVIFKAFDVVFGRADAGGIRFKMMF